MAEGERHFFGVHSGLPVHQDQDLLFLLYGPFKKVQEQELFAGSTDE